MLYSNSDTHGGKFLDVVENQLSNSDNVSIASGYVSGDIIDYFESRFSLIANKGSFKLLVGMAFYEGLSAKNLIRLESIERDLKAVNEKSGVYTCYTRKFHGKIYHFQSDMKNDIYVGSSNFSRSGLSENLECTTLVTEDHAKTSTESYLDYLFSPDNAVSILNADITVHGSKKYKDRVALRDLGDLEKYDAKIINKTDLKSFGYPLSRIVSSEKSSLNVYFGKGRWQKTSGKVTPRAWYEVELIANKAVHSLPIYPQGDFTAYTDDGYIMPMKTSGDYFKNIRSRSNLRILGQWIKGKLQASDALIPLTPVTQETLDKYGNDTIRFYKIRDKEYYIEF